MPGHSISNFACPKLNFSIIITIPNLLYSIYFSFSSRHHHQLHCSSKNFRVLPIFSSFNIYIQWLCLVVFSPDLYLYPCSPPYCKALSVPWFTPVIPHLAQLPIWFPSFQHFHFLSHFSPGTYSYFTKHKSYHVIWNSTQMFPDSIHQKHVGVHVR